MTKHGHAVDAVFLIGLFLWAGCAGPQPSARDLQVIESASKAESMQAQRTILDLHAAIQSLQRDLGLSMLFVTHNLPLVRSIAQRVAVMSHGRIVELGGVAEVLENPKAEYTSRLLSDTPSLELALETAAVS